MRMKVNSNKGMCLDFSSNVFDSCRYDHADLTLVYLAMNFPLCQLQDMNCLSLVLLHMEFTIGLIESDCPSLLLPNPDPILRKIFKAFSEICGRLEYSIYEDPGWEEGGWDNHSQSSLW